MEVELPPPPLSSNTVSTPTSTSPTHTIHYTRYRSELELPLINALIEKELSEPYIVYTYRYFLTQWPDLCLLAWARSDVPGAQEQPQPGTDSLSGDIPIGVIICKVEKHTKGTRNQRGYIAMLSVSPLWRGNGVGSELVQRAIEVMRSQKGARECMVETEVDNRASLALYHRNGFLKEKRLHRFYMNGECVCDGMVGGRREEEAWRIVMAHWIFCIYLHTCSPGKDCFRLIRDITPPLQDE